MPVGIQDEHVELRKAVLGWAEQRCPATEVRAALDLAPDALPACWGDLADQGLLGIHLPESFGGQGAGLFELVVVAEALAHALVPGPWAASMTVAELLVVAGSGDQHAAFLPSLADGSLTASLLAPIGRPDGSADVVASAMLSGRREANGDLTLSGVVTPVAAGGAVDLLLAPVDLEGVLEWVLVPAGAGVTVEPLTSFDVARPVASWTCADVVVSASHQLGALTTDVVRDVALLMASAEAVGGSRWCLDVAAEHARERQQFGRPIGQFQGVKHRVANMLVTNEQAIAALWDAAGAYDAAKRSEPSAETKASVRLAIELAASLALDTYVDVANGAIQVLGGMGFTWEHDAHLHLRRATTLRQLLGGSSALRVGAARAALDGHRRALAVELPAEAESYRSELRPVISSIAEMDDAERQRRALAEAGLLAPHWPAPFGRDAGAVEQIVIDQLCAEVGLRRPNLAVAAWALPTIMAHGTPEQTERWVGPTLAGEIVWCQLFSEPGAGSDLASLTTRATKVDGGWSLTGQKVWTSLAARADMGICLARTNPDVPKHKGITYFLVDMKSPGIDVRPLREITGAELFNEVFFDDCFVPDECVVGEIDGGWRLARTTLANERVSLGGDSAFGGALEAVLDHMVSDESLQHPVALDGLGSLLAQAQSLAQLGLRATLRSLNGLTPGSESSIGKLVGGEFDQQVHAFALDLCGPSGAVTSGVAGPSAYGVLQSKCLTIAGGTSEVQRNVIGERMLGLPRDPEPGK